MAIPKPRQTMRVALCAWEIGRAESGFGAQVGGLGAVVEQLPPALVQAADRMGIDLEVVTLSPCFAHYDRSPPASPSADGLRRMHEHYAATVEGHTFDVELYETTFTETLDLTAGRREVPFKMVYFWDDWQMHWTGSQTIYPDDPWVMTKQAAAVGQAMAGYIKAGEFDTVHLHDYHVALVPFFLGDDTLARLPVHFTIHNATYQGIVPLIGGGYETLARLGLPGEGLFHEYFDFFDNLNLMKACLLKVHQQGGRVTTVSGDLDATWGYAAELRESHAHRVQQAMAQTGAPPGRVFVSNRHLDLFEHIPVAGITNGLAARDRPENLPELKASVLGAHQQKRGPKAPLFSQPEVQQALLARDHNFDAQRLETKAELKRLLLLECFGRAQPESEPIVMTAIGRLTPQKNLDLLLDCVAPVLAYDPLVRFVFMAASNRRDDPVEAAFRRLASRHPGLVYFNNTFNRPLSRLILAGGDFCLMPSRFEPCGLVDYEASLLGTVVIGHLTGGLAKVRHCAYLYKWLDEADRAGEARALTAQMLAAIDCFRDQPREHKALMRTAMAIDAGWERSAAEYVDMYRYGQLAKAWQQMQRGAVGRFLTKLGAQRELFARYFVSGTGAYGQRLDRAMYHALRGKEPETGDRQRSGAQRPAEA